MTKMTPQEKLDRATRTVVLENRFWGVLTKNLKWIESRRFKTAATNGVCVWWNPDYMDTLTLEEAKYLVVHEPAHPLLKHHTRRGIRDPQVWNEAGDHVIGNMMRTAGFRLPKGALGDYRFAGMTTEQVYSILMKERQQQQNQPQPQPGPPEAGSGEPQDSEEPSGGQPQEEEGEKQEPQEGSEERTEDTTEDATEEPGEEPGDEGTPEEEPAEEGGEEQQPGHGEAQEDMDGDGFGGVVDYMPEDGSAPSESDNAMEEQRWNVIATKAERIATQVGHMSAGMRRTVHDLVTPVVPWREMLQSYLTKMSKVRYSQSRPNRRFIQDEVYIPSLTGRKLGKVVIFEDTSGSITYDIHREFFSEILSILEQYDVSLWVGFCDTHMQAPEEVDADSLMSLVPRGGGGTDFGPPFRWVEDSGFEPDLFIYLTDMYGTFPQEAPDYPVLWVSYGGETTPFGEVILMNDFKG